MKMRYVMTGEVFPNELTAFNYYCSKRNCKEWKLNDEIPDGCASLGNDIEKTREKLKEMGFVPARDNPRICAMLGVEVSERFTVEYPNRDYDCVWIGEDGRMWGVSDNSKPNLVGRNMIYWCIEYPETVKRFPGLTDADKQLCKMVGAKWVSRAESPIPRYIDLWAEAPRTIAGVACPDERLTPVARVSLDSGYFQCMKPGEVREVFPGGVE